LLLAFRRHEDDVRPRASPHPSLRSDAARPRGGSADRSRICCLEESLSFDLGRSQDRRCRAPFGFGVYGALRRSVASACPSAEGCLPSSPHRDEAPAQGTQRGLNDSSHGVRSPSAFVLGRSLCRFASPTPSALRVSHSLSGLIPPGPRGLVSCHIRPWGLFSVFRAFPVRSAVAPLDVRCPLAVPLGELSLAWWRLQGVAPTERPFSGTRCYARSRADALLTFVPSEVCRFSRWAIALPSCAYSTAGGFVRKLGSARFCGTSGCPPTEPGSHSVNRLQPP
jgi:hypothetical protein